LKKAGVSEGFPFDESTLVYKVCGKMFALTDVDNFESINLKCEPQKALELREQYEEIRPGYHMNKKHWNSVYLDGMLSDELIYQLVDHSYEQVVRKLPKSSREELGYK
jgi:predicted DNA-binding protein (MmcQ/YjbR family)